MEIAPVGVQMTYANAQNAGQVQHNMNHAAALQQDLDTVRREKETEMKQSQVQNKDDPERQSRGGGYYYKRSKKRDDDEEEKKPRERLAVDPKRGRYLDISL